LQCGNVTGRGSIETVGKSQVLWSQWLVAYLPIDIITIFVAWWLTLKLYPPENASLPGKQYSGRTAQSRAAVTLEKKSGLMLAVVVLWSTDFIHHFYR
jgi:di/tricarboxylate transporter